MYSVILCGGSGNRLWPLSRRNYPKQFLNLYNDKTLLQETFLRMKKNMPAQNIYFITNQDNFYNTLNQIKEIENNFNEKQILVEPASLNTAPAITYVIKHLAEKVKINTSDPIIFLPADHHIGKKEEYAKLVKTAMETLDGHIGIIGIKPDKPETGYGYIEKGDFVDPYYKVERFVEKPNKEKAIEYLDSGKYLWNAGMYLFSIKTFVKELNEHSPEIYKHLTLNYETFLKNFNELPNISIDYAITEKSKNVIMYEGDFDWSDIGSFDSLAELNKQENPKHISIDSKNVYVHSSSDRLVATVGVEDLIVVENTDSILIKKRGRSEDLKKVVNHLKDNNYKEVEHNLVVYRPWGRYETLIDTDNHKVKKLVIYKGGKLSLQHHHHRVEHWIVVKGIAKVTTGDKEFYLRENESTSIPSMTIHRLENPGNIDLEIIEVSTGYYLGEDDIVIHEDIYDLK